MENLILAVLIASFLALIYIYLAYPFFMYVLNRRIRNEVPVVVSYHSIAVVVPAHNEEKVIAEKIENHLKFDYSGVLKVYILCDSCSDATVAISKKYSALHPDKIEVYEVSGGKGKTTAINELMPTIKEDVVIFTDANVMLDSLAPSNVNKILQDESIGGVAGQLNYVNIEKGGAATSNGLYWKYEEAIKMGEAKIGSLIGADGSIFAIRKNFYRDLPVHVLDDFSTSMGVIIQGKRFIFDDSIKAYEKGAEHDSEEFERKIRISNRSYNTYLNMRKELISKLGVYDLLKLYSHKVLRWYSFIFLITSFSCAGLLACLGSLAGLAFFIGQVLFYLIAYVHYKQLIRKASKLYKVSNIIFYFVMVNLASMIGILKSINGERISTWKKAESSR